MQGSESGDSVMSNNSVTACVLIIGNEILSGRTQDLNLQYIAQHLGEKGVNVTEARVIPDDEEVIVDAIRDARERFDYVLTTGGIGPTHDDITAECVAKAFDVDLVENPVIAARIRQRQAPPDVMESRLRMALIPRGGSLIDNLTGGPQGFSIGNVYVMAGIPAVLQAMLPTIQFKGGDVKVSRSVTAHLGESDIATELRSIQDNHPKIDVGSYPFARKNLYGTTLVVRGVNAQEVDTVIDEISDLLRRRGGGPHDIT